MGSQEFRQYQSGESVQDAWDKAKEQAYWEYGHRGYTGSLAEKDDYTVIQSIPTEYQEAVRLADQMIDQSDPRIDDKWGPAGAIRVKGGTVYEGFRNVEADGWLFFGWASS